MRCHYCDDDLSADRSTRDHIIPKSFGAPGESWNIVQACRECNAGKADAVPGLWHRSGCSKCSDAFARWESSGGRTGPKVWDGTKGQRVNTPNERTKIRAWRRKRARLRRRQGSPETSVVGVVPDDLMCLSPAMRDFMLRRRSS